MVTGLKVSSLVRKCVFYRSGLNGKWVLIELNLSF